MSHQDERRRLPRRRTRLSAAVVHGPQDTVVACTVRDKHDAGARLLLQAGPGVPDEFHLIELTTGEVHKARVVWRDQSFVGVTLSQSASLDAPKTPDEVRFAELRAQLTARPGAR